MLDLILMAPSQDGQGGGFQFIIFLGLFFVIIYFFMIRPQTKKAKDQKNFLGDLQKGDKVVTAGGVHGKILSEDDFTYLLEVDSNTKIRVEKTVISMDHTKAMRGRKAGG